MSVPLQADEVRWYTKNGKYLKRIAVSKDNEIYVIGDWAWNREHPNNHEVVEPKMSAAIERAAE